MNKMIDEGVYCKRCELFINYEKMSDWECYCNAEEWKTAKIMMVTDSDK